MNRFRLYWCDYCGKEWYIADYDLIHDEDGPPAYRCEYCEARVCYDCEEEHKCSKKSTRS